MKGYGYRLGGKQDGSTPGLTLRTIGNHSVCHVGVDLPAGTIGCDCYVNAQEWQDLRLWVFHSQLVANLGNRQGQSLPLYWADRV